MAGVPGRPLRPGSFTLHLDEFVDILSLKRRVPTFTLGCTDGFHQAPELDDVVVEPPEEYFLNRLRAAGMCTNIWWKLQKQLPGRRQAEQRWVDHFTSALSWGSFFWNPDRQVGMEVHMDDVHGFGPVPRSCGPHLVP